MLVSFADKLAVKDVSCIFLVQTENEQNEPLFAYIEVPAEKVADFRQALSGHSLDLTAYGRILLSDKGHPTQEQQSYMATRHGFNHAQMQPVPLNR